MSFRKSPRTTVHLSKFIHTIITRREATGRHPDEELLQSVSCSTVEVCWWAEGGSLALDVAAVTASLEIQYTLHQPTV